MRNLPFKVTEDDLTKEFAKFGIIKECNILKREDGKLVGCAFIQYDKVNHAAKAIHHANGKELFGRPVIIDWAVNNKKFKQHLREQKKSKTSIKIEKADDVEIKQESESDDNSAEGDEVDGKNDEDSENSEDDDVEDEGSEESDDQNSVKDEKKPIHQKTNDVAEGCTVFIKNIPFESTKEDLFKVCRQFGPIYYAVITVDKVSGHSKGNGFVKFKVINRFTCFQVIFLNEESFNNSLI